MNLLSRELINQGKTVNRSEVIDRYGKRRTDKNTIRHANKNGQKGKRVKFCNYDTRIIL